MVTQQAAERKIQGLNALQGIKILQRLNHYGYTGRIVKSFTGQGHDILIQYPAGLNYCGVLYTLRQVIYTAIRNNQKQQ